MLEILAQKLRSIHAFDRWAAGLPRRTRRTDAGRRVFRAAWAREL